MTLDKTAQRGYEEMLRREGVHPFGPHAWENQSDQLRADWRAVAQIIIAEEREACAHLADLVAGGGVVDAREAEFIAAAIRARTPEKK